MVNYEYLQRIGNVNGVANIQVPNSSHLANIVSLHQVPLFPFKNQISGPMLLVHCGFLMLKLEMKFRELFDMYMMIEALPRKDGNGNVQYVKAARVLSSNVNMMLVMAGNVPFMFYVLEALAYLHAALSFPLGAMKTIWKK
jgi:hypothetical protein